MSTTRSEGSNGQMHDVIPGPQPPSYMSLPELALALSMHQPGTARSVAVEDELRRRLLREKDAAQRTPPTVAFLMGALVTVTAIQVGAVIRSVPTFEKHAAAPSSQMSQQVPYSKSDLRRD